MKHFSRCYQVFPLFFGILFIHQFGLSQESRNVSLFEYMERVIAHNRFSGSVIVQQDDQILLSINHGVTEMNTEHSITSETPFDIGSISKQFTATAILKMCSENKIKLHDPINNYLGRFASKRWKKVTVHHLLSHQSGIPSVLQSGQGLDHYWPDSVLISWEEQVKYFNDLKLIEKPGEEYRYNNTGYILLALIIENVSGKPFETYMQEIIFEANGLDNTSVGSKRTMNYAKNHFNYTGARQKVAPSYHSSWYRGAGGVYSSASDLIRWLDVLYNGDVLLDKFRTEMFTKQAKTYGYGWVLEERNRTRIIHHDGTNFGSTGFVLMVPEKNIRMVLLTNQTHEKLHLLGKSEQWIRKIAFDLLDIIDSREVDFLPKLSEKQRIKELDDLTGYYTFQNTEGGMSIEENDDGIKLKMVNTDHSIYRHYANVEVNDTSSLILDKAIQSFDCLLNKRFWKFGRFCDGEMKLITYMGVLSMGFRTITKRIGTTEKVIVYEVGSNYALARFFGTSGNVDFILYFNSKTKVSGLFDTGYSDKHQEDSAQLVPLENGHFFIDGFPIGEVDSEVEFSSDELGSFVQVRQNGKVFFARKQ